MSTMNIMGSKPSAHSDFVGDVQQLQNLKQSAGMQTKEGLETVAKEFESMYLKMMLDSMRAAEKVWSKDNPFSSREQDMFRDMLDGQLSKDLSASGSLGLADMLVRQLSPFVNDTKEPKEEVSAADRILKSYESPLPERSHQPNTSMMNMDELPKTLPAQQQGATLNKMPIDIQAIAGKPDAFIQALMPYAQEPAQRLGVDPRLLVAQAALETGWGQSLERDGHGFNLFGIKASKNWQGDQAVHPTHEVYNHQIVREKSAFRHYDSVQESFDDYVDLIERRYESASNVKASPEDYIHELAQNGYATDPAYADKVLAVYNSARFKDDPLTESQAKFQSDLVDLAMNKSFIGPDPRLRIW